MFEVYKSVVVAFVVGVIATLFISTYVSAYGGPYLPLPKLKQPTTHRPIECVSYKNQGKAYAILQELRHTKRTSSFTTAYLNDITYGEPTWWKIQMHRASHYYYNGNLKKAKKILWKAISIPCK